MFRRPDVRREWERTDGNCDNEKLEAGEKIRSGLKDRYVGYY